MNIVQIGSNKGNDDLSTIIFDNKEKIKNLILVEPLSLHNNDLDNFYRDIPNRKIINSIISDREDHELINFYYHVEVGPGYEVASLDKNHIIKHYPSSSDDKIVEMKLPSLTIDQLLKNNDLKNIDILFIDAEGMDDRLIRSIDFNKLDIKQLYFGNLHLDYYEVSSFLKNKGYELVSNWGYNGWMSVATKRTKVIDCFTFYNELDMLTLRLNELSDFVDYFVLVESTHTHTKTIVF